MPPQFLIGGDNTWKIIEALENVVEQRMAIAEKRWSPFSKNVLNTK